MSAFSELGLSDKALEAVNKLQYDTPTPVQLSAIPAILDGRDVIAAASTGTGKTAAFLLPTISKLEPSEKGRRAPRILVITPTRELAQQIAYIGIKIARTCGQYVTVVYGGAPYKKQIANLSEGTDILVATPGRLVDLLDRKAVNLSKIEVLVLDEADRMLDMGFLPDIKKIVSKLPDVRQTLLFSATIDASIKNNFEDLLDDPQVIQIAKRGETAKIVDQYLIPVPSKEKPNLLRALLYEKPADRIIIFARTKSRVEDVAKALKHDDFNVVSIHSDKTQAERRQALSDFHSGRANIIVATDVLARGIDVPSVDYVINYDLPDMAEDYIHRIGRTGRAGEKGFAVSFATPRSLKVLDAIQSLINREIPIMRMESYKADPSLINRGKSHKRARRQSTRNEKNASKYYSSSKKNSSTKRKSGSTKQSSKTKKSDKRSSKRTATGYNYEGYGDLRRGKKKAKSAKSVAKKSSANKSKANKAKTSKVKKPRAKK